MKKRLRKVLESSISSIFSTTFSKLIGDKTDAPVEIDYSRATSLARGPNERVTTQLDGPESWKEVEDIVKPCGSDRKRDVRVDIEVR